MYSLSNLLHRILFTEKTVMKVSRKNWCTPDKHNTTRHNKVTSLSPNNLCMLAAMM
uniref:Uncharacterized protein n=1 Tax=Magallana gigas TaxID=29159 RepID=K1Q980_MAGGI